MPDNNPLEPPAGAYQPADSWRPAAGQQPPMQPGMPPSPYGYYPEPQPQPTNTMAILALVFAFVFSPLGIIFGAIGLKQIKTRQEGGRGLALSGLILGSAFTAIPVIVLIVAVVAVNTTGQPVSAVSAPGQNHPAGAPTGTSVKSPSDIPGVMSYNYAAGQQHVTTPVHYQQSPPVGGPHDPYWADCTGTVYTEDIRHENAVHSLEHGAVWITYNPEMISSEQIATLATLVTGQAGRFMSPYAGLDSPISIQSWNHQLKVRSASDPRLKEFADFFDYNPDFYPEIGASCENPDFTSHPLVAGQPSEAEGSSDGPTG